VSRAAKHQAPVIVPFRGGADTVINLVGGNIDCALANFAEAETQLKSGDVRPLMIFAEQRLKALPNVPTGKEAGVNAGNQSTVRGFVTAKGVPADRLKMLEDGLVKAMQGQMFQTYLENSGQAMDSVTGAGPWKAQLDQFMVDGKQTLEALGLLK
jgi:tripartite-type tricarboxylate transporter receptor subunit TctC